MEIPVVLGEVPSEPRSLSSETESDAASPLTGVEVQDLTPQLRQRLELPPRASGVLVVGIERGTPAAEAGLMRGDVIQEVNGEAVANSPKLEQVVRRSGAGPVMLLVNRGGSTFFVVIEPR
jgi:serine protease Do